jgi:peptidoglycan biosynthesis protein MviN/MurJ (putative lipid II flippase)
MGFRAIALGTALGSLVNVAVLVTAFEARVGGLVRELLSSGMARMVAAAALMGPAAWYVAHALELWLGTQGLRAQLVTGLVPVAAGGVVYLALSGLFRVPEATLLVGLLRRRGRLKA